jgi:2-iminobutanoate/2-iminopropanoate deaminase
MKVLAVFLVVAVTAALSAVADADQARPAIERLPAVTLNGKPLPFSAGVRVGEVLYLSGQIGLGTDDKLPTGFQAQAKNTLDRIGVTLKGAGLSWKDVIRCTVFLSDMANWPTFNEIYTTYVDPKHLPARSALGTSGLALGALLEVQCDAYDPPK